MANDLTVSSEGRRGDYSKSPASDLVSGAGLFSFCNAKILERQEFAMPTNHQPQYIALADARPSISDGDLLLFRRRGLISIAGRD